jgi:hypothetical protein
MIKILVLDISEKKERVGSFKIGSLLAKKNTVSENDGEQPNTQSPPS